MKARKPATPIAAATHACYVASNRAGVLRNGRAVRSGERFRDRRKEAQRLACRKGST